MQLACSSALFDRFISEGHLTQLEWVDLAARSLPVQGLVFAFRHFPRIDDEYVAEIRKLCVDRSLVIAALSVDGFFDEAPEIVASIMTVAVGLGVPVLLTNAPLPSDATPAYAWREAAIKGKALARVAKKCNITIAVRNAPHTLCVTAADLKRLTKDIDSAWIRFAPDISWMSHDEVQSLRSRSIMLTTQSLRSVMPEPERKGFLVMEGAEAVESVAGLAQALREYADALYSEKVTGTNLPSSCLV